MLKTAIAISTLFLTSTQIFARTLPSFPAGDYKCSAFISDSEGNALKVYKGHLRISNLSNVRTVTGTFSGLTFSFKFKSNGKYRYTSKEGASSDYRFGRWHAYRNQGITIKSSAANFTDKGTFYFMSDKGKIRANFRDSSTTHLSIYARH